MRNDNLDHLSTEQLFELLSERTSEYTKYYFEGVPLFLLRSLKKVIEEIQKEIHERKEEEWKDKMDG